MAKFASILEAGTSSNILAYSDNIYDKSKGKFVSDLLIDGNKLDVSAFTAYSAATKTSIDSKANTSAIPTKVSQLTNDKGYLTEHQSLAEYAKTTAVTNSINSSIQALDVSDSAVASQFVTSVSETDGKINVTRGKVDATNITYNTSSTVQAALKKLMDKNFPLTLSYSITPTSLQEMGTTASVTISNISGTIDGTAQTLSSKTVNGTAITGTSFSDSITASKTYTVKIVTNDGTAASKNSTVTFVYPMFAGYNSATAMTTSVISALTKQALRNGLNNMTVTATNTSTSNYFWFVSTYNVSHIYSMGVDIIGDFEKTTVTYLGTTYKCYRLKYASLADTFTYTIS